MRMFQIAEAKRLRCAGRSSCDHQPARRTVVERAREQGDLREFAPLAPPAPPRINAITVGDPIDNFAIGSFTLRRETFGAEALHARLTVANFSPQAAQIAVTVSGDDKPLGTAKTSLGPRETGVVEFPSLGPAKIYKAELTPSDGFPLDNIAYATAGFGEIGVDTFRQSASVPTRRASTVFPV